VLLKKAVDWDVIDSPAVRDHAVAGAEDIDVVL